MIDQTITYSKLGTSAFLDIVHRQAFPDFNQRQSLFRINIKNSLQGWNELEMLESQRKNKELQI